MMVNLGRDLVWQPASRAALGPAGVIGSNYSGRAKIRVTAAWGRPRSMTAIGMSQAIPHWCLKSALSIKLSSVPAVDCYYELPRSVAAMAKKARSSRSWSGSQHPPETLHWYKDAVIYQLHVRSYYDSDANGIGDFAGLTQKLDYLQDLGVTALWLLPFYPSPLRDDGYDIADYTDSQPGLWRPARFQDLHPGSHRRNCA